MSSYHRLTQEERYQIQGWIKSHTSIREMASLLGRAPSSISRELRRNKCGRVYHASRANKLARKRRSSIGPPKRIDSKLKGYIDTDLGQQWRPEQISGSLRRRGLIISHETIYQYIFEDFKRGGELYKNLARKRKFRRSRKVARNLRNVGKRSYTNWIDKRPAIVELRSRIGDFERDTLLGKARGPVLLTIVDRTSRLTKIAKISGVNSVQTHLATLNLLKGFKVHTITNDNGAEFALHYLTAKELKAKVYFNHPYSSWQRGTNENTNGLIRQYFPKGTDFTKVSEKEIQIIEDKLNNRPRKCLGYKTPLEVHRQLSRGVALST